MTRYPKLSVAPRIGIDTAVHNNKQLLDEVYRDIQNYQGRGKRYQPKPKAAVDWLISLERLTGPLAYSRILAEAPGEMRNSKGRVKSASKCE